MKEIWQCAYKNLSRRPVRTILTVSGILIGVLMVVIVAIISGAGKSLFTRELENMGVNGLSVSASANGPQLSREGLSAIRQMRDVESAMPLQLESGKVEAGVSAEEVLICGIDAGANQLISLEAAYGRLLSRRDIQSGAYVCVVDQSIARKTYRRDNITGKQITLNIGGKAETFQVVGVAKAGSSLLQNISHFMPGFVYVPYTVVQQFTGKETFQQIAVRVRPGADADLLSKKVVETLERTARLPKRNTGLFKAENLAVQKERLTGLLDIVTLVLMAISGISLVVSGLSIMTIMLVSVNERVAEIGLKRALGATRRRIMLEFLAESAILSVLGSVVGILIGLTIGLSGVGALGIAVPPPWALLGILIAISLVTGAGFGIYPSIKASRLHPVDALRE